MGSALFLSRNLIPSNSKLFSNNFPQISMTQNVFILMRFVLYSNEPLLWTLGERQDLLLPRPYSAIRLFFFFLPTVWDEYKIFSFWCSRYWFNIWLHDSSSLIAIYFSLLPQSPLRIVFESRFLPHQLCCSSPDNCLIVRNGDEEEKKTAEKSFFILYFWFEGCQSGVQGWIRYRYGI